MDRAHEMPLMAEGDADTDAQWIVYRNFILAELYHGEIASGSAVAIHPEKFITLEFAMPLCNRMELPSSYKAIAVRFEKPPWTYEGARAWWASFEAKIEDMGKITQEWCPKAS